MTESEAGPIAMTRYVLIAAAATIAGALLFAILVYALEIEPGGSMGNVVTLAGIVAGASMFGQAANRPMRRSERLWFAAGVTLVNLVLPIVLVVAVLGYFGLAPSMEGVSLLLSGGQNRQGLTGGMLLGVFGFVGLLTFGEAYLFGWLMTRKLPLKPKGSAGSD